MRTLAEEIARVVRGRAANPRWIRGMMRHGYRGAGEIARALDSLHGFAATLPHRLDRQFDLLFDATLGDPEVSEFLSAENPQARAAMAARFAEAMSRDLWRPRRNTVAEALAMVRRAELAPAMAAAVFVCRPPLEAPTGRFLGVVHIQRLLREPPQSPLGNAVDRGLETDLVTGLEIERMLFAGLFATRDRVIGMTSFVEQGPGKARFEGA